MEDSMAKEKKSTDMYVDLPDGLSKQQIMEVVERAAERVGLYISHIGSYSRKKYPNSVHWHFKRDAKETGLIDATYWDVKSLLWLMVRHREPEWVQKTAPKLHRALRQEAKALGGA
jgi:hypothetical protein